MADHRTKSAESTTNNTPASSVVRPGAPLSESTLWEPALLSVGGEGSTSSTFRLPELALPASNANTGGQIQYHEDVQLEQWDFLANFPDELTDQLPFDLPAIIPDGVDTTSNVPFGDLGVYMGTLQNPAEKLPSWANTDANIPVVPPTFESNSRQPATLPRQPRDGLTQRRTLASDIHMPDATLTRTEAPPYQPIAENYIFQMPVAAPNALPASLGVPAQNHDARNLLLPAFHASPPTPAAQHRPACPHRRRYTSDRATGFGLKACPENDTIWSTKHALVPHANVVAMPAIGVVGAFMRTAESFLELPEPPPPQATTALPFCDPPIYRPLPALPLPPPTATDLSAPHRYPRIIKPRARTQPRTGLNRNQTLQVPPAQQPWQRTNAAMGHASAIWVEADHASAIRAQADYASAIWNRAEQVSTHGLARFCRISDPQQAHLYRSYPPHARPSTRGLTYLPAVGTGALTPVQRPAANNAVGLTVNTKGRQRARRGAAMDPQSVYARNVQLKLADRIKAQDMYLKMRRRVRINERLQILQQLIPNGTEVESLVNMLDEAFNYVKFLEHQVELLYSKTSGCLLHQICTKASITMCEHRCRDCSKEFQNSIGKETRQQVGKNNLSHTE